MEKLKKLALFTYQNFAPLVVFYLANHFWGLKPAIAISLVFVIIEMIHHKFTKKEMTSIFKFSACVSILFGLLDLSLENTFFFKIEASLTNLISAGFFGVTLWQPKSLIQQIAEQQGRTSQDQSADKTYFFKIITAIWTIYFVLKAVVYLWINFHMSFNEGLLLRAVIGNVSFGILLFLTLALSRPLWNLFEKLKWLPSARKSQDFMNVQDKDIKAIMSSYSKYCVYGLSNDPEKASHYVPLYMRDHKWDMVGIYPKSHTVNNFKIYDSLKNVPPDYRKMVNVFRSSDRIPEVVDEILEVGGVEVLWLQLGISNPEAEARAEKAGLKVISNRCLIIEHKRWF